VKNYGAATYSQCVRKAYNKVLRIKQAKTVLGDFLTKYYLFLHTKPATRKTGSIDCPVKSPSQQRKFTPVNGFTYRYNWPIR
jgi:hypothetical protein